jgi:hypothetical protein
MYVGGQVQSRMEALKFMDAMASGSHLKYEKLHLEKVAALIVEPISPGKSSDSDALNLT